MTRAMSRVMRRAALLGCVAGVGLSLGGCQVWNNWLDFLKWKGAAAKKQEMLLPGEANAKMAAASLPARMIVYKITLPVGTFSTNDKIWSQLNEDAIDSKTNVLLAQNGLRAATGPISSWESLSKLIDVPGAMTDQMVCETDGRSTLNVVTRSNVSDQIVVSIDRDLQQQGRTFEKCDNGFRLTMRKVQQVMREKGVLGKPQLMVQLEPVVTEGSSAMMRQPGNMTINNSSSFSSEEGFSDLQIGATLNADQFLVVSAEDPKESRFSVGSLWLSNLEKVPATETVMVFVPAIGEVAESGKGNASARGTDGKHL